MSSTFSSESVYEGSKVTKVAAQQPQRLSREGFCLRFQTEQGRNGVGLTSAILSQPTISDKRVENHKVRISHKLSVQNQTRSVSVAIGRVRPCPVLGPAVSD